MRPPLCLPSFFASLPSANASVSPSLRPVLPPLFRWASLLVLLALQLWTVPQVWAAKPTDDNAALVQGVVSAPLWGNDTLSVALEPDEKACRKLYGDEWYARCAVWPGTPDTTVRGVTLQPAQPGQWRWRTANVMEFVPELPWPAATAYTVDIARVPLSARARPGATQFKISTLPLAAHVEPGKVWIDPDPKGEHALSFALRFTTALTVGAKADLQKKTLLKASGPEAAGLKLGPVQWVWTDNDTRALVKARLLALPPRAVTLGLSLPQVRALAQERSQWKLLKGDASQSLTLPGTSTLFALRDAELKPYQNQQLQMEQHLTLRFTRRVTPEEVLAHLRVLELPEKRDAENVQPTNWTAGGVSDEDLSRARPLSPQIVRLPGASADTLCFRLDVIPGRYVLWQLPAGFAPQAGPNAGQESMTANSGLAQPVSRIHRVTSAHAQADGEGGQAGQGVRLALLQPGNVLVLGGTPTLDMVSEGLDSIRWRAARFLPDRLGLNYLYSSYDPDLYEGNLDRDVVVSEGEIVPAAPSDKGKQDKTVPGYYSHPLFSSLAAETIMPGAKTSPGVVHLTLSGYRGGKEVVSVRRLLVLTDMGMVVKQDSEGRRQVFVCSLSTGQPLAGVRVSIVGVNGLPVSPAATDRLTDAQGLAVLPSVNGLGREKTPQAVVAVHDLKSDAAAAAGQNIQDMAWMSLTDSERDVDYSRFPIQGQRSAADGINAYVFAQRGIFRPGETLHFGMMLRRGNWQSLPPDMPFTATLRNPAGRVVLRRQFTAGAGLTGFSWASPDNAVTGRYNLAVSTPPPSDGSGGDEGLLIGSGAARVEEFQPDTLAIKVDIQKATAISSADSAPDSMRDSTPDNNSDSNSDSKGTEAFMGKGWLHIPATGARAMPTPQAPAGEAAVAVRLDNLYGLPAAGHKVRGQVSVGPASLQFPGYHEFTFPDMQPLFASAQASSEPLRRDLRESLTNAQGKALLPLGLGQWRSGTLHCTVLVEGFETDGGRAVTAERAFLVSPLSYMLGYRPDGATGNLDFIPKHTQGSLHFIAVNPDLALTDPGRLTFEVSERRYVTSLVADPQGNYRYDETPLDTVIRREEHALGQGLQWPVPTDKPGEYLLTVRAPASLPDAGQRVQGDKPGEAQVLARIPFTVAGDDDLRPGLTANAQSALPSTHLRLRTDKEDYSPGEKARLFLSSPYAGTALITLERDRVVTHRWVQLPPGNSVQELPIPEDFEGRGYINVSVGRALSSPEIFIQPHAYAVAPVTVNVDKRRLNLQLSAPQQALPGSPLVLRLRGTAPAKAVVFAVDEGVLQLTRFKTPDPLRYLLLDRALEVRTSQFFDRVMPDHTPLLKRLPAFGGGMDLSGGRFHNPFKRRSEPPLAWWSGVVDVGTDEQEIRIPLPGYYNGSVRIMAVGAANEAVGHTEARSVVRAPLILTPQVPLLAAPGDRFEGALAVRNASDTPVHVKLSLTVSAPGNTPGNTPEKTTEEQEQQTSLRTEGLPAQLTLAAGQEQALPLRFTAGDRAGAVDLHFRAENTNTEKPGTNSVYTRSVGLSLRPPLLPRSELRTGRVESLTKAMTLDTGRDLRPVHEEGTKEETATASTVTVATTPLPLVRSVLGYLRHYAHGCVEQSVSRAFPLALLHRYPALGEALRTESPAAQRTYTRQALERAGTALGAAYARYSGVAAWPDGGTDEQSGDLLLTAYAADYVLALREAGLPVPPGLHPGIFQTLEEMTDRNPESMDMLRAQAYAAWVLARAGYVAAQRLETYEQWLREEMPGAAPDVAHSLMAGAYAAMRMDAQAQRHLDRIDAKVLQRWSGADFSSLDSAGIYGLHVAVLARHFPQRLQSERDMLAARLTESMNAGYATQGAALAARALLELARAGDGSTQVDTVSQDLAALDGVQLRCVRTLPGFESPTAPSPRREAGLLILDAPGCAAYSLTPATSALADAKKGLPLYWELRTYGYDRTPPTSTLTQGLSLRRNLLHTDGSAVTAAPQPPVLGATEQRKAANKERARTDADVQARQPAVLEVEQGDVLRVELEVRSERGGSDALPVAVVDLLPGGFEMLWRHDANTEPGEGLRIDRREDRFIAYVDAGSAPRRVVYHIRAVNKGEYALPATQAEGLFDASLQAHTASGRVTVK